MNIPCPACGKVISDKSLGHYRLHVKRGEMRKVENFTLTKNYRRDKWGQRVSYMTLRRLVEYVPVKKVEAR